MCKNYQVKFIDLMKGGNQLILQVFNELCGGRCGCDRMVVGFTTTCAISGYHH
jgi:hypothetical protein